MSNAIPNPFIITIYTDPGHGWGLVKRSLLRKLGILSRISGYSYQAGHNVYLEEDQDLFYLVEALKAKGITIEFTTDHTNDQSPIRSREHFRLRPNER